MPTQTTEDLLEFDNSFARELPGLYVDWEPAAVREPAILVLNEELAVELETDRPNMTALLCPQKIPRTAYFEILERQFEAGAETSVSLQG